MANITSNIGTVRRETINGRNFLVADITLIKEGILNGSAGPIFYPASKFNPDAWNGIPIVLNHPASGSARNPEVFARQAIGTIFNAETKDDKLVAKGYFDAELTMKIDNRIFDRLAANETIEVSTGVDLSLEKLDVEKIHMNQSYNRVVTELHPDHLAVLPDAVGACSVSDGCGIFNGETNMKKSELVESLIENSCCWDESDNEVLSSFTNAKLESFMDNLKAQTEQEVVYNAAVESFTDEAGNVHTFIENKWESKLAEVEVVELTDEQWMEKAPEFVKTMIANSEAEAIKEKAEIIEKLTENVEDKEAVVNELNKDSLDRLRTLVVLAAEKPEPVSNFSGQAEVPQPKSSDKEDFLPVRQVN